MTPALAHEYVEVDGASTIVPDCGADAHPTANTNVRKVRGVSAFTDERTWVLANAN